MSRQDSNSQKQEIEELQNSMEDQINRGMRSTLIFKGIKEEENEFSWEDTTNVLANQLSPILNCDPMQIVGDIERAHRGKGSKSRNIYVKFNSWKASDQISKLIIKANRSKITHITVSQMYGPKTTAIMNEKLKLRKDIIKDHKAWKMYVAYPGTLMLKKPGEKKFTAFSELGTQ